MRTSRQGVTSVANRLRPRSAATVKWLPKNRLSATSRQCRSVQVQAQKQLQKKIQAQANNAGKNLKQLGPIERLAEAQSQLQESGVSVSNLLQQSLIASLTFGTAFQVTHNNGLLPIYDVWPIKIGPFLESGLVPLVLAPIWLLYGYLAPVLDQAFEDEAVQEANIRASSLSSVALTWALCAAQFIVSDILYLQGFPHWQIYLVMAASTAAIWTVSDRTKTGLGLSALLAIGAPLGEAVIVALGLWHYERPDNPLGICYWTGFCYASYAYGVANFARWQVQQQRQK